MSHQGNSRVKTAINTSRHKTVVYSSFDKTSQSKAAATLNQINSQENQLYKTQQPVNDEEQLDTLNSQDEFQDMEKL